MNGLYDTHVKLLAFDFLSLAQSPAHPHIFFRKHTPLSRVETLGTVVSRELKPDKFLKFHVDDGTGVIPCVFWLNQLNSLYYSRRNPSDVETIAAMAADSASKVGIGVVVRVRGKITAYKGALQITVMDVVVERDPNAELLHWLDCLRLARKCYDVVVPC